MASFCRIARTVASSAFALTLFVANVASAQTATGGLRGFVKDGTGAVGSVFVAKSRVQKMLQREIQALEGESES